MEAREPREETYRTTDVYAARERAWMVRTQEVRGVLLGPLLRGLARLGIKPDHITLLSLLSGLAFCPLFFYSPPVALTALALHVLLDGLDGPLARHLAVASPKGSFTDSMADQATIIATTITLAMVGMVDWLPAVLYLVSYTLVVLFAMARNAMNAPYSWLLRPRFYVYLWIPLDLYVVPSTLNYGLWFFSIVLFVKSLTGFVAIRRTIQ